MPPQRAQS